jgi:hypothetical protein
MNGNDPDSGKEVAWFGAEWHGTGGRDKAWQAWLGDVW